MQRSNAWSIYSKANLHCSGKAVEIDHGRPYQQQEYQQEQDLTDLPKMQQQQQAQFFGRMRGGTNAAAMASNMSIPVRPNDDLYVAIYNSGILG
ncbi:hypothetical protein KEM55_000761, partial [Ascosphaera atra]